MKLLSLKLLLGFLFFLVFVHPIFAQEQYFFQEEFNVQRLPNELDPNKWLVYPNKRTTPDNVGCMFDTIREANGVAFLHQCNTTPQFPYVISKTNPVPNSDFTATIRFQFAGSGGLPSGIKFVDKAPGNGEGETELFSVGFVESGSTGQDFRIEYKDNVVFSKDDDPSFYVFGLKKEGKRYKVFLNDQLIFTSPPTEEKIGALYIGSPAVINGFKWSDLRVDYIRVVQTGPLEQTSPQPFLELPWNYEASGMSFNEAATSINSYFDHEYPLLSAGLNEPTDLLSYLGTKEGLFYSGHDGYDYGKPAKTKLGTPVLAPADGEATFMNSCGACGNAILIDHKNGYQTRYYHLDEKGLITTDPTQTIGVTKGQKIGEVGFTGNVDPYGEAGSHLHFMVIQDKNSDGNFQDNIPDGITDPFGWQSTAPDPWENYSFFYNSQQRTGNKSYYLFTKKLDTLNAELTSNAKVFEVGKTKLEFSEGATNQNLNISVTSEPNYFNEVLNSLGSVINITAKDPLDDPVTVFLKDFLLTINFSQFDLNRYNLDTLSIYSSNDGQNWTKENTYVDLNNKTASTSINHLTRFALMAERKDTIAPTTTATLSGDQGITNNFRSDVTLNLNPEDNPGGLGIEFTTYSFDQTDWKQYETPIIFTEEGVHKVYFYSQDNDGNVEEIKSVEFLIDKTPPVININSPVDNFTYLFGQLVQANYSCSDQGGSLLQSCQGPVLNGGNINSALAGQNSFTIEAQDNAGNQTTKLVSYKVEYPNSGSCLDEVEHAILQPINSDASSIFKQGSTIPAKFRICDINNTPISNAGLIKSFNLIKTVSGTITTSINEPVISTTPDSNFRYDLLKQQWIFNMNTKSLSPGKTYFYRILLNDLSEIQFSFGLK